MNICRLAHFVSFHELNHVSTLLQALFYIKKKMFARSTTHFVSSNIPCASKSTMLSFWYIFVLATSVFFVLSLYEKRDWAIPIDYLVFSVSRGNWNRSRQGAGRNKRIFRVMIYVFHVLNSRIAFIINRMNTKTLEHQCKKKKKSQNI
jgi:hypothetical protein